MTDYTLPPVPHMIAYTPQELERMRDYGHACAEHVRAPLLARIAEMEQSVETFRAARDGYRDDAFRLSADKRALLQGGQEQASEIARLHAELAAKAGEVEALRRLLFNVYTGPGMGYTDDGELQDGTVHPSIDFLRMTPEQIQEAIRRREGKGGRLGELAAEVEALRAALSQCATAVGASAAPDCSVEFLACVPREVELVVEKLRADAERWKWRKENPTARLVYAGGSWRVENWTAWHPSADAAVDAAIAARKGEGSESQDPGRLKQYGYAPGDYMAKCHACGQEFAGADKRATTCRGCAEAAQAQAKGE